MLTCEMFHILVHIDVNITMETRLGVKMNQWRCHLFLNSLLSSTFYFSFSRILRETSRDFELDFEGLNLLLSALSLQQDMRAFLVFVFSCQEKWDLCALPKTQLVAALCFVLCWGNCQWRTLHCCLFFDRFLSEWLLSICSECWVKIETLCLDRELRLEIGIKLLLCRLDWKKQTWK